MNWACNEIRFFSASPHAGELDHLTSSLIYVHPVSGSRRLQHERAHTVYYTAGPVGGLEGTGDRGPDLVEIWGSSYSIKFSAALRRLRTAAIG